MKQREEENKRRADDLSRFDQKIIKENKMYGVEGGEARARLEAEKRNRLNLKQQLEDIEDPNSELRKNYVVGSEKQDEASQSRIAAIRASADAKKSRYGAMADLYADDAITDLNEMFGRTILTPITPNRDTVIKTFLANRYGINEADFYRSGTTTVDESKYNDALHKAFLQEIEDKEYNQRIAAENLRFNTQEEADEARTKKKLELGNLMAKSDDTFSAAAYDAAREIDATTGKAYDEVIADRDRVQKTSITLHNQQVSADYRINIKDEYKKVEAEIIRQRTYDAIKATHPERYHSLSEVTAEDIADYTRNVQREIARSRVFREAAPGIYADISAVTDQAITDYINHNDPIQIVANGDIEVQWRKAYAKNRQNDLTDESSKTTAELEKVKKEMASSKNGNS